MEKYNIEDNSVIKKIEKIKKLCIKKKNIYDNIQKENQESYVVELCGLPNTGKTECIKLIKDFFERSNIKVELLEDPISNLTYKDLRNISKFKLNEKSVLATRKSLEQAKEDKPNIIIMENGLIDNYFYYQSLYDERKMTSSEFRSKMFELENDLNEVDQIYIMSAGLEDIVNRDNKVVVEYLIQKNKSISELFPKLAFIDSSKSIDIDTTDIDVTHTSLIIIDSIIKGIYKKQNIDSKKAKDKSEYTEEKPFLKVLKSNNNFKDNN